ncbi:hypothetical protein BDV11DRAFT_199797 [Aspergillus similis]
MSGEEAMRRGQRKIRQDGCLVAAVTARAGAAVASAAVAGAGRHVADCWVGGGCRR